MRATLRAAMMVAATAALPITDAMAAMPRDNNPQHLPEMTGQIPNPKKGAIYDNGWRYVMNGNQFVVDHGRANECPAVLIFKEGVDRDGNKATLFSLATLPFDTKINPDKFHTVNVESGTAVVDGDRIYDFNNSTPVDSDFISAGIISSNGDYQKLNTPRVVCIVTKEPDGTIIVTPPPVYTGGCTDNQTSCPGNGSDSGNTPGQPSNPGGNPLPISYNVSKPSANFGTQQSVWIVKADSVGAPVLQI